MLGPVVDKLDKLSESRETETEKLAASILHNSNKKVAVVTKRIETGLEVQLLTSMPM